MSFSIVVLSYDSIGWYSGILAETKCERFNFWFGDFNFFPSTKFVAFGGSNPILFRSSVADPPTGISRPPSASSAYGVFINLRYIPPVKKFFFREIGRFLRLFFAIFALMPIGHSYK